MTRHDLAPPDSVLRAMLERRPRVALVGASIRPERPSYQVMAGLLDQGYDVVPVHPTYPDVLGRAAFKDLGAIDGRIDVVDVFRRPDATPEIARQAVAIGAAVLWLQLGVINHEARRIAEQGGLVVVMDRCLEVEHHRLIGRRFDAAPAPGS